VRLSDAGKSAAISINKVLRDATTRDRITDMRSVLQNISQPLFKLDYAEIIDEETFEIADEETKNPRAIIAGWIDGIRLIDNLAMKPALVKL
jgi:pantoate--beta-alanine ligase